MVGIIQEQHPDRCRLFMQWKQMDWPILVDSLNLLGVSAVPITLAIDEHGIIRHKGLRVRDAGEIEEIFLGRTYEATTSEPPPAPEAPDLVALQAAAGDAEQRRDYAAALVMWGNEQRLDEAIAVYREVVADNPDDGWAHFRLGVALRKRYDSKHRRADDFQQAVDHWKQALDLDPNQYIWRRRIQQYGPRLDKPYPFYDWVRMAREEITARGEQPAPLLVEPRGAEFAEPLESFSVSEAPQEPDPRARIHRDEEGFVKVEATVVPPLVSAGETARVHIVMRPNEEAEAHWNNEAEELVYWINLSEGWQADRQLLTHPIPRDVVSREPRAIEFEVRAPDSAAAGETNLPTYALYYVCEDIDGTCLYRRQDIPIPLKVR